MAVDDSLEFAICLYEKANFLCVRFNCSCGLYFLKQQPEVCRLAVERDTRFESNIGQRSINETAQAHEASFEYVACSATNCHLTAADRLERKHGSIDRVSQLVCNKPKVLGSALLDLSLVAILT